MLICDKPNLPTLCLAAGASNHFMPAPSYRSIHRFTIIPFLQKQLVSEGNLLLSLYAKTGCCKSVDAHNLIYYLQVDEFQELELYIIVYS